jgi:hypothetical protein
MIMTATTPQADLDLIHAFAGREGPPREWVGEAIDPPLRVAS